MIDSRKKRDRPRRVS